MGVLVEALTYSLLGIALGFALNETNKVVGKRVTKRWASIPIKLAVVVFVLALIDHLAPKFAIEWQTTTGGMLFTSFAMGLQTNLFGDLTK